MKQIVVVNRKIKILELPVPSIDSNEILVKNMYSAISTGTELHSAKSAKTSNFSKVINDKEKMSNLINSIRKGGIDKSLIFASSSNSSPLDLAVKATRQKGR